MQIVLSEEPEDSVMTEARIIKEALRGRAQGYEEMAKVHEQNGATLAALMYTRRAAVVRRVLLTQFGDEYGSMAHT